MVLAFSVICLYISYKSKFCSNFDAQGRYFNVEINFIFSETNQEFANSFFPLIVFNIHNQFVLFSSQLVVMWGKNFRC